MPRKKKQSESNSGDSQIGKLLEAPQEWSDDISREACRFLNAAAGVDSQFKDARAFRELIKAMRTPVFHEPMDFVGDLHGLVVKSKSPEQSEELKWLAMAVGFAYKAVHALGPDKGGARIHALGCCAFYCGLSLAGKEAHELARATGRMGRAKQMKTDPYAGIKAKIQERLGTWIKNLPEGKKYSRSAFAEKVWSELAQDIVSFPTVQRWVKGMESKGSERSRK